MQPFAQFSEMAASQLSAPQFEIRPQRLEDNPQDYAAVMANRDWLRRWSGSDWPPESFSSADNLEDLRGHIREHEQRTALGFNIASADGLSILGSLYVQEVSEWLDDYGANADLRAQLAGVDARVDIWGRLDRERGLLDEVVAHAHRWFAELWSLRPVYCSRPRCPELVGAYESAGLQHRATLTHAQTGREHLLFR